jgi:hypothetical protein
MTQGDLFDGAAGAALRDAGMTVASDAQERAAPDWLERAYQAIVRVALESPSVHVDDVLAIFLERPDHPNAWGSVWTQAIRNGVISRTGRTRETNDRRKHRHQYPIYRSEIYRDQQIDLFTGTAALPGNSAAVKTSGSS